jgi:RNA polymerase sigma-70 factor (ECF subfamily)
MSIIPPEPSATVIDVESVYRASRDAMVRSAYYRLGSWQDAEDAVQEAFALAWQQRHELAPCRDGRALMSTLARYQALAVAGRRRARREQFAPTRAVNEMGMSGWIDRVARPPSADTDDGVPCLAEAPRQVRAALAGLPPRCREALELRALQGLSTQDAARRAGVSVNTLYCRFARGLRVLRRVRRRVVSVRSAGRTPAMV